MKPVNVLANKMDRCARLLEELNAQVRDIRKQNTRLEQRNKAGADEKPESVELPAENVNNEVKTIKKEPSEVKAKEEKKINRYNTDKYGHTYTEKEIQNIIKD